MLRRALLIVTTLAGLGLLALLGYVVFRASPPPASTASGAPADGSPAATATGSPGPDQLAHGGHDGDVVGLPIKPFVPATAAPPPAYRANTIVDFPDADVAFMSINIDLDDASPVDALATIADAAHVPFEPARIAFPGTTTPPKVGLHLKDQPFLEAILQLEAQASLSVSYDATRGYRAQGSLRRGLPGIWSISGPFAFMLINMEHTSNLATDGRPNPAEETVLMQFDSLQEPGLKVLRYPMDIKVIEATDNHGNSLISSARSPFPADGNAVRFPPRATLAYPADNPGRRIKHFRAEARYLVQLKAETITINDPLHGGVSTKTASGILAKFDALKWTPAPPDGTLSLKTTYSKSDDFKGDWPAISKALSAAMPHVRIEHGPAPLGNATSTVNGDVTTVTYTMTLPAQFQGNPPVLTPPGEPQVDELTIDIPTGVKQIDVPVELNDIPLP